MSHSHNHEDNSELEVFRQLLLAKHGNFLLAWRIDMDLNQDFSLSFQEFCTAANEMNYKGDTPTLWRQMGKDG